MVVRRSVMRIFEPTIKRFVAKVVRVWVAKIGGCEMGKKMAEFGNGFARAKVWGYFGGQSGENPEGG